LDTVGWVTGKASIQLLPFIPKGSPLEKGGRKVKGASQDRITLKWLLNEGSDASLLH